MTNRISSVVDIDVKSALKALKDVEAGFDGTESAGKRAAAQMSAMADVIDQEAANAASAVEALGNALGPEFSADLDKAGSSVDELVSELKRAGLTYDDVRADADALATSIKRVESSSRGTSVAIDGVTRSGDQSRSVLANMVGNSAQDLGALTGVAGSAGVAIGQLAEYAADGNISLANMGKLGLGLGGVAVGMWAISQGAKNAKENAEKLTQAIEDLSTASDELVMNAYFDAIFASLLDGGPAAAIDKMAQENLPGLKRALDLGTQSGRLNAEMQEYMADAIYEAERAAAQGELTQEKYGDASSSAAEDVRNFNEALGGLQGATTGAVGAVGDYIDTLNGIPEDVQTEISAALDAGDYGRALALIEELTRNRIVKVGISVVSGALAGATAGGGVGGVAGVAGAIAAAAAAASSPSRVGGGSGGGGGGGSSPAAVEADTWGEAIARAYEYGEITRDEYRRYLAERLAGEPKYGDAYHQTWSLIQALDKEAADERDRAAKERADEEKRIADEAAATAKEAADAAREVTKAIEQQQKALGNLIINVTNTSADPQSVVRAIEQARRQFGSRWLTG